MYGEELDKITDFICRRTTQYTAHHDVKRCMASATSVEYFKRILQIRSERHYVFGLDRISHETKEQRPICVEASCISNFTTISLAVCCRARSDVSDTMCTAVSEHARQ